MSRIIDAKKSIEAELAHAKKGLAYYVQRVEALERALSEISQIEDLSVLANGKAKGGVRGQIGKRSPAASTKAGRRAQSKDLPSTGGDFWKELINETPASAPEILKAAIAKLGFEPNKDQIKRLSQRMAPALSSLVGSNAIRDSGKGRARRYFK